MTTDGPAESSLASPSPGGSDRFADAGMLLLGFVVLAYEIVQIRIFGYALSPTFVYSVIPITLLGFGLSATVLSVSTRLRSAPLGPLVAAGCIGFALFGLAANVFFARVSPEMAFARGREGVFGLVAIGVAAACALPYAFAGLAVAAMLSRRTAVAPRLYAWNLLGSGLGCLVVNELLRPLGAERLVVVLLAVAALAAVLLAGSGGRRWRVAGLAAAVLLGALVIPAPSLLRFQPDSRDMLASLERRYRTVGAGEPVREFSRWDPVGRIEVHSWPGRMAMLPDPVPYKLYTQDGGAPSTIFGIGEVPGAEIRVFDDTLYGVAHQLRPNARVLVIGLGGGPDVLAAVHHRARRVIAVEINRTAAEAVTGPFAAFAGRPYDLPNVDVLVRDGRSFVRQTTARFDVIQLSGTDTLTVQSSGSFVWAESYLYTVEAFTEYLGALAPDGLLSILRFGNEPYRLGTIACLALRGLGVESPDRNVVVLGQAAMNLTLVKRTPWTGEEIERVEALAGRSAASNAGIVFEPYDWMALTLGAPVHVFYAPGRTGNVPEIDAMFEGCRLGREPPRRRSPSDDRPFYFAADLVGYFSGETVFAPARAHIESYMRFAAILVVLAGLLIVAPIALFRRRGLAGRRAGAALAYFFLLGVCFMLVEIGLLQKSTLVVEHPSYSVSVVLAALLGSGAFGSWLSGRLPLSPRRVVLVAASGVLVFGGIYAAWGGPIFDALLPLAFWFRMIVLALLVAPLGVAMGMPFPTGLRVLGEDAGPLAAWAVGVNGFASVLGSVLSMPFAVLFGFSRLFGIAVAGYVLAAAAFVLLTRRSPGGRGTG